MLNVGSRLARMAQERRSGMETGILQGRTFALSDPEKAVGKRLEITFQA
ncbi:MAG: hypothetical protein JRE23_18355 [Deltaproteobacteria bacterium]|nr:hypothetical protein [Deltaproteobacteria bacterium]